MLLLFLRDDFRLFHPFGAEHNLVGWINPDPVDHADDLLEPHFAKQVVPGSLFFEATFPQSNPFGRPFLARF